MDVAHFSQSQSPLLEQKQVSQVVIHINIPLATFLAREVMMVELQLHNTIMAHLLHQQQVQNIISHHPFVV